VGKPPKSWLAAAQDELDEVSLLGEAGASAERTTRSTLDGGDDSEAPGEAARVKSPEVGKSSSWRVPAEAKSSSDNVSDGARGDDSEEPDEVDRTMSPEEPEEKSSFGRGVPVEAKSSSDNVSEDASRDEEAEVKESPQERNLVEDTFTRSSVIDENKRRIYEVDEKPEGRPRRRIKTPGKYSDFVMDSAKNRQIRVTSKSQVTRSLSEVMPPNGRVVPRMLRPVSELHCTKEESAERKGPERSGQKETKRVLRKCRSMSYCPVCNRQFGQKFNMFRHLAVVHDKDSRGTTSVPPPLPRHESRTEAPLWTYPSGVPHE